MDLRPRLSWRQRLPGRVGTAALWLGSCSLVGPAKLIGVLLIGSLITPCLLLLERNRPATAHPIGAAHATVLPSSPLRVKQPTPASMAASQEGQPTMAGGLPRAALAAQLGLPESQLFRARHAAICTVHHDAEGRIVELELPGAPLPLSLPSPDAHPVG